ncbi:MAG TPA: hypothetical protein VGL02_31745 [Streptomyces sp.]
MPSLRTALVLTLTAAAAALAPAGVAAADGLSDATGPLPAQGVADALPTQAVADATGAGIGPVKNLTLDPLSNTGVDPLDNAVAPQVADFKPVSTTAATGPLTRGGSLSQLPVVGPASGLLPG